MKLSKPSNKVRWILVLPAVVIVFFCVGNLFGGAFGWSDKPIFAMCGLFTFLTGITIAPLHGKRFITVIASVFIISCLFPPWRSIYYHTPDGYSVLFNPPTTSGGVQIDFGRLFLEWAALGAITGILFLLRNDKPPKP
ncbi:MAG TPA: hypothetical protein VGI63_08460 [Verrucomicrobiae bacterium]|jgi:glucan phosphoethanolaminetransferase (alkaline phosphatase superfamily)